MTRILKPLRFAIARWQVLTIIGFMTISEVALASCPNICVWQNDYAIGCDRESTPPNVRCMVDAGTCYFDLCPHGASLKCDAQLKFASEISILPFFSSGHTVDPTPVYLTYVPVNDAPVRLGQVAVGGPNDLLREATILNVGPEAVRAVRFGWIIGDGDGRFINAETSAMRPLPKMLERGEELHIIEHGFVANAAPGFHIALFVAEVEFSSRHSWKADIERLRRQTNGASAVEKNPS